MLCSYRQQVLEVISTLASADALLEYEKSVPICFVPDELCCQFFDDAWHPKSSEFIQEFTEEELQEIGIFAEYLELAHQEQVQKKGYTMNEILKLPCWQEMMSLAKKLVQILEKR